MGIALEVRKDRVAALLLKLRDNPQLVFASHDDRLASRFRDLIGPFGVEMLSITDMGRPEPVGSDRDALLSATIKATVVAAESDLPAAALARFFHIDPLLRWGGGGPQWSWPQPWPYASENLASELTEAYHALDAGGYCGPDDRGAYFRSVLCLVWPDGESQSFEGRVEGQFGRWGRPRVPLNVIEDYFIPDGEAIALAHLSDEVRALYSDKERAFEAFLRTFIA
ncbi:MAG: non-canonical purine NTP pyrophosphatase [Hyphomicrobiaceae bacterium]